MANNPRVPCVLEGARRPDRSDAYTGSNFTPEGISISVGDVMPSGCGTPAPGGGAVDEIGGVTVTGVTACTVGFSSQYTATWTGGITPDSFTWSLDPNTSDTGTATISAPGTGNPQEINFTGAGTVTIRVTVVAAAASDTPQTADLVVTVTA